MSRHDGAYLAVIKDAMKTNQKDPSTWTRISPDEAKIIRTSYYEGEAEITKLKAEIEYQAAEIEMLRVGRKAAND